MESYDELLPAELLSDELGKLTSIFISAVALLPELAIPAKTISSSAEPAQAAGWDQRTKTAGLAQRKHIGNKNLSMVRMGKCQIGISGVTASKLWLLVVALEMKSFRAAG